MKKYILTEKQVKTVIDALINEESAALAAKNTLAEQSDEEKYQKKLDASYNNVWANPKVSIQMKKIKPAVNGKYAFSAKKLRELDQDFTNKLYVVKAGDTVDGIVNRLGGNSSENIMYSNDLLQNNPKNLRVGDVIAYSLAPSGN
jgi:hypothetical protein